MTTEISVMYGSEKVNRFGTIFTGSVTSLLSINMTVIHCITNTCNTACIEEQTNECGFDYDVVNTSHCNVQSQKSM